MLTLFQISVSVMILVTIICQFKETKSKVDMQNLATREDIEKNAKNTMKWTVGIMLTSLITAVAATAAVVGVIVN